MAELVVPPELVGHLRSALLGLLASGAERLAAVSLSGVVAHMPTYEEARWTVQAADSLLQSVGVNPAPPTHVLLTDDDSYPWLLYRTLRSYRELLRNPKPKRAVFRGRSLNPEQDERLLRFVDELSLRLKGGAQEAEEQRLLVALKTS